MFTNYINPTIYDVRRNLVRPPPKFLMYSQLTGSTNNLMMAKLTRPKHVVVVYYVVLLIT